MLILIALAGCSSILTDMIIQAPNHGLARDRMADSSACWLRAFGIDREMRIEVGPPASSMVVWVVEPTTGMPSRGTILVLHGFGDGAFWMLGKAKDLAAAGFRTVLVSQRGYGQSTGDFRTYGVVEKRDLSQIIDALQREHLCGERVGVWGMSYGAAMALELAGHDERVKAVVAVAGFSSMRAIVPRLLGASPPFAGLFMNDSQCSTLIDDAAKQADFDPNEADATRAMAKTHAAVLLAHGQCDLVVPYENALRLLAAGDPSRTELLTLPLATHVTIWFDVDRAVATRSREWFEKWLAE
jgi:pimeloyl-ACP methyl ester carboxylesterase